MRVIKQVSTSYPHRPSEYQVEEICNVYSYSYSYTGLI